MDYKKYIEQAFETASRNGFHDEEKPMEHFLMLVITEVSEAVEADRKGKCANVAMFDREAYTPQPADKVDAHWKFCFEQFIKDTVADEFADICIRLFDLAGTFKFDVEELDMNLLSERYISRYNSKSFTQVAHELSKLLTQDNPNVITIQLALGFMECWAKAQRIDLQWHIEHKMQYNKLRSRMHGKKY